MNQTPQRTLSPGDVVAGRYRIDAIIGKGGFGAVFRATQLNLGRTVALKVLLPDLVAQDEGMSRFRREAELAQRLEHPNTVRLLDFGQSDSGVPFIAFELLKGQALDELLRPGQGLPAPRVARITSQILKSLMEAHRAGIVHRDIKPSNVFLCDFSGEPDFVKVLDFGIAKPIAGSGQTAAGLTRQGVAIGTPHYMAPEQVAGNPVGPTADVYSLGLMMAEMLTGEVVFKGNSALQICMDQLSTAPVPLPPEVLQSPLGAVIHRATQKALERRYATAGEMLEHLEAAGKAAPDDGRPSAAQASAHSPMAFAPTGLVAHGAGVGYAPPPGPPGGFGYGPPQPAYPGAPPHVAPVMPAAPAAPRAKSGCGLAAAIGIPVAVVVALGGCGALYYLFGDRDGRTTSSSSGGRSPIGRPARGALKDLSGKQIKDRLESLGYSIVGETTSTQQGISINQYTVTRTPQSGAIMLYKFNDESIAKTTEDSMRNNASAQVVRDGTNLLIVIMQPSTASREVLDALIK